MPVGNERPDAQQSASGSGGFTPRQLFWLKGLVIGLGLAIILAVIVVIIGFAGAVRSITDRGQGVGPAPTDSATPPTPGEQPSEHLIDLPADATVTSMSASDDHLVIHYRTASEERIAVVRLKNGKRVANFRIRKQ